MSIKKSNVAGLFYPSNSEGIKQVIYDYKLNDYYNIEYKAKLVIAPHAGYRYSGFGAYLSLKHLSGKNIFIIAPAHKMYVDNLAIPDYDYFQIPNANIPVNKEIAKKIIDKYAIEFNNNAFNDEHSIEVQLPLISNLKDDFNIIPILVGNCNYNIVYEIINDYYNEQDVSFIISSDLSHFLTNANAIKIDNITARLIETNLFKDFHNHQACNINSIRAAVKFAALNKFSFIRLFLQNSYTVTKDKDNVVGYGSWFLYEGDTNSYIKKYHSDLIKKICFDSILNNGKLAPQNYPCVLNQYGACFVTLEKRGELRGCIGSIAPYRPLIDDLIANSYSSAYADPRFKQVDKNELDDLDIKISLLSKYHEINFVSEDELLEKIEPFKDGLIISDLGKRAVYLPSVWEQIPNKKLFLQSLKQKAGFKSDHFSTTFKAYKFYTEYI